MAAEVMSGSLVGKPLENDTDDTKNMGCREAGDPWQKEQSHQVVANNQQKKGHRRKPSKKKKKWKPYNKLSWEERKALDEREQFKAFKIREEMKEKGRPVAPYNTTQYLMDEHDPYDGGFEPSGFANTTGTDEGESFSDDQEEQNRKDEQIVAYTDSPHMVSEFISQDFSETYERVHEESLNTMSRDELLQEHMDLEQKFNQLQEQHSKSEQSFVEKSSALEAKVFKLENEKKQLKREVKRLLAENEAFRRRMSDSQMSDEEISDTIGFKS